ALAVVATLLVVFLVWTIFSPNLRRTTADALLTMIVIFFAISWMNGIGSLFFEDQNPMVQIIPILLIGLGVDYSIHLTSRYREEVAWSANVDGSVSKAITTVGVALVLATVTTAAGFLTNVTNDLPALREFGWLASIGIVASFLLMLTFVPAVRELLDRRGMRRETMEPEYLKGTQSRFLPRMAGQTSWLAKKVPAVVLVVAITLGGLGVYGWSQLEAKFSFLDFIPTTSPLRGTFETLLDRFGGGFGESTQVLIEGDVATAESWNAMIDANQATTQVDNVVLFGGQPAARSPMAIIGPLLTQDSPTFNPEVAQAAQTVGMDQSFKVTGNVDPLYDAAFAVVPEELRTVISVSETGYNAALFDITTQGGETGAAQLSDDLNVAFAGVAVAGNDVVVTSDEIISDVIITTLRDSQTQSLILTLLVALLVLVANFWFEARRPVLGVITALPVVLVVLLTFSFMTVFGIPYGPVTATIAALGIGIGIPYMIHITHRFLEDRIRCDTGEEAVESTLGFTGGALAGSALTTIAGFGILVTSTTIPFQQFGLVTAVTIGFALLTAILILPSLLTLWDRYHRRRGDIPVEADVVERALQTGGAD
ncbi:MAG: RND family transporter, partial [Acidimicrobiia bacterium]